MVRFVVVRVLQMVPLLLGITFLTFAIVNLVPGSPVPGLLTDPRVRQEDVERMERSLGLDRPWPVRYVEWLSHVARGDLGRSLTNGTPVADRILGVLPNTLLLAGTALALSLAVAIPLGTLAAAKHNTWLDRLITVGAVAGYAMPIFWLGLLLIIVFAVKFAEWGLPALPVGKTQDLRGGGGFFDRLEHLVLPAVTLALTELAGWTRYVRSSLLDIVRQDYVRTARAKGLPGGVVFYRHALRNALLPIVTVVGLSLPGLVGGAFVTETVFAWNGVGRLAVQAAQSSDYTLIMGTVLLFAVVVLVANLIVDLVYSVLDPTVRHP